MHNSIAFDRTVELIQDRLNINSLKQNVISGNLANMNTPGYAAREVTFDSVLRKSLEENVLSMVRTDDNHLEETDPAAAMKKPEVTAEGGPVDFDWEMMKLARNSVEYQYMVNLLGKKFSGLRNAIDEGGK